MGTDAHLVCWGTAADADWTVAEIDRLEAHWSRFRPGSDVVRCNEAAGTGPVPVAPATAALVDAACAWWRATDGRFDPTVLPALVAHGYDDTIAAVQERPATAWSVASAPPGRAPLRLPTVGRRLPTAPTPGCAGIVVDRVAATVSLPAGVAIDLGGIGKGTAADLVTDGLRARGVTAACLSLGGDVRAYGPGTDADGWQVPVEDPLTEGSTWFVHPVADGALATSTDRYRRWHHAGREQHHLIDPATGRPAESGLTAVVVAHPSCAAAEVLAKATYVAGPTDGPPLVERLGGRAWLVPTGVSDPI